jgi:hypothetical protein
MRIVFGVLQWTIAIASVAGTLALLIWIAAIILRKDNKDDATGDRH